MSKTVIGLFDNMTDMQQAIAELQSHGFAGPQISVVLHPSATNFPDRAPHPPGKACVEHMLKTTGPAKGGTVGALAGGTAGVLTALSLMAFPGLNLDILAAGPIVAVLAGGAAGAAAGGLVGVLIGLGSSAHNAEALKAGVESGGALVTVVADDEQSEHIVSILAAHHAVNVERCDAGPAALDLERRTSPVARPPLRMGPPADAAPSIYANPDRSTSARIYIPRNNAHPVIS